MEGGEGKAASQPPDERQQGRRQPDSGRAAPRQGQGAAARWDRGPGGRGSPRAQGDAPGALDRGPGGRAGEEAGAGSFLGGWAAAGALGSNAEARRLSGIWGRGVEQVREGAGVGELDPNWIWTCSVYWAVFFSGPFISICICVVSESQGGPRPTLATLYIRH